ncbi:AraC family transcriptional regulator [Bacteroides helcogenes]|uniref:Transcriptional regulator, AraC family n=1 Tax=Bacteroides helcogenes (strain ATCC 35417 / DSM 20613 / JCM 6297 / CCUG 15421 / P 36-108) TaxID=693979 RepID=E6SQX7_BACT6|nr:helix-turn-helix domain-containing protein [Bacteroides helcogenes]ADV45046.1 transcriptional regulator, AraC family [Bacteroides helcogenes P 36-108]MDY5239904.1 helix-turn-helix domain-containing protein [Bacteroides helcogenes]
MNGIRKINTIHAYNEYMGVETLHPLVSVIDMSKCTLREFHRMNYGLYGIFLKDVMCGPLRYGINYYDYQKGTIVAVAPGQIFGVESEGPIQPKGWALVFHPDLIYGTELGRTIKDYTFFSYDANEALHISEKEREIIEQCFVNILTELNREIDKHTNSLIARSIGMLLDYCMRYYDRQFITRGKVNKDVLTRFENLLDEYFESGRLCIEGVPSVSYCAGKVFLSPNYFGDMIKKETGKTAQEYIQLKIIDRAKQLLAEDVLSVNEIAEELGFKYSTHFTRLFRKCEGMSPSEYRRSC